MTLTVPRRFFWVFLLLTAMAAGLVLGMAMGGSGGQAKYFTGANPAESRDAVQPNYYGLSRKVNDYFAKRNIVHSYVFEDLRTGTQVKSAPDQMIASASLTKLPYVMDIYHLAEAGKLDLKQPVVIQKAWLNDEYGDLWRQGAGSRITLEEAARLALVESDNTAINIVRHYDVKHNTTDQSAMAYTGAFSEMKNGQALISAELYNSYLRCLYHACYLSAEHSDTILDLLTQTDFKGLPDGVPGNVKVAHKIGESLESYSDCGIVYYPGRSYSLCVMIGLPPSQAQTIIKELSSLTYVAAEDAVKQATPR